MVFLYNSLNVLMRIEERTLHDPFCKTLSKDDQIATNTKLLDIMDKSYGFSDDLCNRDY